MDLSNMDRIDMDRIDMDRISWAGATRYPVFRHLTITPQGKEKTPIMSLRHFSVGSRKRSHAACGSGWDWSVEHGTRVANDQHILAKTVDNVTCRNCKNTPVYRRALECHERKRRPSPTVVQ